MNCRTGDIARVIRGRNKDAFVSVRAGLSSFQLFADGFCWEVEALTRMTNINGDPMPPGSIGWIEDARLRPLRDPGDDAVDETLLWKPTPREVLRLPVREMTKEGGRG